MEEPETDALQVFVSYAHEDKRLRDQLDQHLAALRLQGLIARWHDGQIVPSAEWEREIDSHLKSADVVLLLISPAFVASDYCYRVEMQQALKRHDAGQARVVPILLRPVDWPQLPFARLQALPTGAKPITTWRNQDAAFVDVAQGLRRTIEDLRSARGKGSVQSPTAGEISPRQCDAATARPTPKPCDTMQPKAGLVLTIPGDFNAFTERDKQRVLESICRLLETDETVEVVCVRPGSIKLTLALSPAQAQRLQAAVTRGALREIGVVAAEPVDLSDRRVPAGPNGETETYGKAHDNTDAVDTTITGLLEWEDRGETISPSQWIANHPAQAAEIAAYYEGVAILQQLTDTAPMGRPQDDTLNPVLGQTFGDYQIIRQLGKGGMGVVFQAVHRLSGQTVALKVIHSSRLSDPDSVARFQRESLAAAAVRHPNIVRIFEEGEYGGRFYYAMEYVEGETLAELAKAAPLTARDAARFVAKIAGTVQLLHDHETRILHRDLKPSNVLLDAFQEPRLADFGLAVFLNSDRRITPDRAILGTLNYLSPEQASGERDAITERSDIYSMGAILYELLAGQPPQYRLAGESPPRTSKITVDRRLREILEGNLVPPPATVPAELNRIVLRCLSRDPNQRYPSARALADDLERFLETQPVPAEEEAIARARTDQRALGDLLEEFRGYLRWAAARRLPAQVRQSTDASDIVQETFRQALNGFSKFRGVSKREFCGWLGKIHSHNVFQAVQAAQKRPRVGSLDRDDSFGQAELEADQTSPSIRYMRLEAQERLHQLLERIPDVQREAVMLRFLEALPVQEIARRLGKTQQAVGGLLRRGMSKLREIATHSQAPGGEP